MNPLQQGTSTSATLRPRNRRLISVDDEFETLDDNGPLFSSALPESTASSFLDSRAASPLPSAHPSRSTSTTRVSKRVQSSNRSSSSFGFGGTSTSPTTSGSGLWGSWSSIQEIASTLLGNDLTSSPKDKATGSRLARRRKPIDTIHRPFSTATAYQQWGPPREADIQVVQGSQEDRRAQVQAKRREALLNANGHTCPDSNGKYKRRKSEDSSNLPDEQDRDALVYLHKVVSSDTLAGIAIRYNCPVAVVQKANRLWANDRVQIRDTIYLPVDACGVRGRKLRDPIADLDLLGDGSVEDTTTVPTPTPSRLKFDPYPETKSAPASSIATSPSGANSNPRSDNPPWKHDSWVMIDPSPIAIEIARLPRRTLGFFPPSRRKSVIYSDLETPSVSFDLARTDGTGTSPAQRTSPRRHESPHPNHKSRSSSVSYFAASLQGPGGVGSMGKDIRNPGPAQDRLNQLFAPHLPNTAPRTSFESIHSTSSTGIENVGGAIEGWMRKMATKAAAVVQTPPLRSTGGAGDLIELVEGWELDGDHGEGVATITDARARESGREDREDEERMLSERFPVRGRVFEDKGNRRGD